jgi:hypothetical protein
MYHLALDCMVASLEQATHDLQRNRYSLATMQYMYTLS